MVIFRSLTTTSVYKLIQLELKVLKRYQSSKAITQAFVKEKESISAIQQKPTKPPFAKNLFLGIFDKDVLIYPEVFTIEALNLMQSNLEPITHYFKEKVVSNNIIAKTNLPNEIIQQLKSFNLFGLMIPKEYGGQGLSATEYARFCEVTALDSSVFLLLSGHQSIGVQSILLFGSEEQKQKYLPKFASGEWLAAFCISEDISGSDVASVLTTAEKNKDYEDSWCINGKKLWVTNGTNANVFTVLAKTVSKSQFGDMKGVSAFIVEKDYPGVTVSKPINMTGVKGVDINEITFENVVVPSVNLIGEEGQGFKVAIEMLNNCRFTIGTSTVAMLKELFGRVTEHIISRKQFTTRLINCEQIQKKCAEVALTIYALESMTYMTTGLHDKFQDYDGSLENAIIKAFAMENGQRCIDICLNLLGAHGCVDNSYEKYSRDFRAMSIYDGALDITKLYISSIGLYHSSVRLKEEMEKGQNVFSRYSLTRILANKRDVDDNPKLSLELYLQLHSSLTKAANQLEYCVLRLQYAVNFLFKEYETDLINHQVDLLRLTSIVLDVYGMTAVLGRASRAYCTGIAHAESEVSLAQKYCCDSFQRVKENVNDIIGGAKLTGDTYYSKIAKNVFSNHGYDLQHPTEGQIYYNA